MPRIAISDRAISGALALALALGGIGLPAAAQPVVQAIPGVESRSLNAALARVATNPRDSGALVDAGNAALAMNDVDAAIGFFTRAQQVAPGDARAKAGLAGAYVRNEDPYTAITMFNEAEREGPLEPALLADRGLAYDLVGDNATAQRYYRQAGPTNDEALRRLALSLAISGDKRGSEIALSPLMTRQDKSAWRTRAFSLAILGEEAQAESIATATMPASLAASIAPYLRYMRQLTRAQQAAAANLGHFPRASEIGRDDPRIAAYAPPSPRKPATGADAGLIPSGEPLGGSRTATAGNRAQAERASQQARQAQERQARLDRQEQARLARAERQTRPSARSERERPPEPVVAVSTAAPPPVALAVATPPPARPSASPAAPRPATALATAARPAPPAPSFTLAPTPSAAITSPAPPPVAAASTLAPSPAGPVGPSVALAAPSTFPQQSGGTVPSGVAAPVTVPAPLAVAAPAPPPAVPARPRRLADAFGDLAQPAATVTPSAGAVDIRRITPSRPPEVKSAKPAVPAQPSRIWVQVATGRGKPALGFDWKRMAREDAAVFRGKKPYVTAWGQTNRLLTGPFETEAAANAFVTQLRRADVDGAFLWTSPAGQIVDALPIAK